MTIDSFLNPYGHKPVIGFGGGTGDAWIASERPASGLWFAPVLSPFAISLTRGLDLNYLLKSQPQTGDAELQSLVADTADAIEQAKEKGVDGIAYLLPGASPEFCSPMMYGGQYLEVDRELLQKVAPLPALVLTLGKSEVYFDSLSDLPGAIFAWDIDAASVSDIRGIRNGLLSADADDADIRLIPPPGGLEALIPISVGANV